MGKRINKPWSQFLRVAMKRKITGWQPDLLTRSVTWLHSCHYTNVTTCQLPPSSVPGLGGGPSGARSRSGGSISPWHEPMEPSPLCWCPGTAAADTNRHRGWGCVVSIVHPGQMVTPGGLLLKYQTMKAGLQLLVELLCLAIKPRVVTQGRDDGGAKELTQLLPTPFKILWSIIWNKIIWKNT